MKPNNKKKTIRKSVKHKVADKREYKKVTPKKQTADVQRKEEQQSSDAEQQRKGITNDTEKITNDDKKITNKETRGDNESENNQIEKKTDRDIEKQHKEIRKKNSHQQAPMKNKNRSSLFVKSIPQKWGMARFSRITIRNQIIKSLNCEYEKK